MSAVSMIALFIVFFALQMLLCIKSKSAWIKQIPAAIVIIIWCINLFAVYEFIDITPAISYYKSLVIFVAGLPAMLGMISAGIINRVLIMRKAKKA